MSDIPSLSKRGNYDCTLQFPNKRANHPRQSVVNKKNDEVELRVSGILQTPHILPLRLTNLLILHHLAVINNYSPAIGAKVAELTYRVQLRLSPSGASALYLCCLFSYPQLLLLSKPSPLLEIVR